MPRVIGIDPGTVSIDVCGLEDGRVFLDRSVPTAEALAAPDTLLALIESAGPLDLVTGPSGYGLPLVSARDATEIDLRLACLAGPGEQGGIGGLRSLMRLLAMSTAPVIFTPGVIHLPSVPAHRKVNRVDMGTADKVCATALAIREYADRHRCQVGEASLILLELGGAFTAAIAVESGRIVDGVGGTSGPLGLRASGGLDGEVAFLAGSFSKGMLFDGGAAAVAGTPDATAEALAAPTTARGRIAWEAYVESAVKAAAAMSVAAPGAREVILSGRLARVAGVRDEFARRLARLNGGTSMHVLSGFAEVSKQAAQGAALLADGLAGGAAVDLVSAMGIRDAAGTVLDHLYVISQETAKSEAGNSVMQNAEFRMQTGRRMSHQPAGCAGVHVPSAFCILHSELIDATRPHRRHLHPRRRRVSGARRLRRDGARCLRRPRSAPIGQGPVAATRLRGTSDRIGRRARGSHHRQRRGRLSFELREPPPRCRDARGGPRAVGKPARRPAPRPRSARSERGAEASRI